MNDPELDRLRKENDILRALLPKLGSPCVYCGMTEIGKCERGFLGCAHVDDIMCGEESFMIEMKEKLDLSNDRVKELEQFVMDCAKNWDCDEDSFRKNHICCRACSAEQLMGIKKKQ